MSNGWNQKRGNSTESWRDAKIPRKTSTLKAPPPALVPARSPFSIPADRGQNNYSNSNTTSHQSDRNIGTTIERRDNNLPQKRKWGVMPSNSASICKDVSNSTAKSHENPNNIHDSREERYRRFVESSNTTLGRKEQFDRLRTYEKYELCLSDHFDFVAVPGQNIPPGWDKLQLETAERIRTSDYGKRLENKGANESDYSSGEEGMMGSGGKPNQYLHFLSCLPYCPLLHFSFHAVYLHEHGTADGWCFCPCSRSHTKKWRDLFYVNLENDNGHEMSCDFKRKPARGFLKHIESKKESCLFHDILFEYLSELYKNFYHSSKNDKPRRHIAFEDVNTADYRKTMKYLALQDKKTLDELQKIAEQAKATQEKLERLEKEKQMLEATNRDLSVRMSTLEKLKVKLGGKERTDDDDKDVPLDANDLKECQEDFKHFAESVRQKINISTSFLSKQSVRTIEEKVAVKLQVNDDFRLSKVLHRWYDAFQNATSQDEYNDYGFLFCDLNLINKPRVSEINLMKIIGKWEVTFEVAPELIGCHGGETIESHDTSEIPTQRVRRSRRVRHAKPAEDEQADRKEIEGDLQAKDEGGPTREFFNRVWNQLGDLEIFTPATACDDYEDCDDDPPRITLFERTACGYVPITDTVLKSRLNLWGIPTEEQDQYVMKAQSYFRAIGRMMAHCIFLAKKNYGPLPLASISFPKLLQEKILRGRLPTNQKYKFSHLAEDFFFFVDKPVDKNSMTNAKLGDALTKYLGSQSVDETRKEIEEAAFGDRTNFLKPFSDGISLNGRVNWPSCIRRMHRKAIDKLLFARQEITEADLFDEDGDWRLLCFCTGKGVTINVDELDVVREIHDDFERKLADLFRTKLDSDPTYINRFVHHCTGLPYIPDLDVHDDFHIVIEFNNLESEQMSDPESLPVAHTCTRELKLPLLAYGGDMEVFEEKMRIVLEHSEGSFNMT